MEWNTKWDWENIDIFNSKDITSPKKLQSAYWGEEDIDASFNGIIGGNSSAKSSISASTDSSFKEGIKGSSFSFEGFGCFTDSYKDDLNGTSPLEGSACSGEPFIGLKLGKRTYFENSNKLGIPVSKKVKSSCMTTPVSRCQVEGCNLDLSSAKNYHRKHRVCETHSKSPKVIVAGLERRFCQQCSRFHSTSEFDEEKRSCRRRLSDHNARRRKPHQEAIGFNSTSPYSSIYETDNSPPVQTTGVQLSDAVNMPTLALNSTRAQIYDQGLKEPNIDLRRALSLLSNNNAWVGSCEPNSIAVDHLPQEYHWQADQQSIDHPLVTKTNNHFQIFKSPYGNSFNAN